MVLLVAVSVFKQQKTILAYVCDGSLNTGSNKSIVKGPMIYKTAIHHNGPEGRRPPIV